MSEPISYGSVSSVASRQCLQEFTVLCRTLHTSNREDLSSSQLEDELGRFRVWLGNIGGVQKGHSSLEYRLREAPLVLESVLKLLRELSGALRDIISIVSGQQQLAGDTSNPPKVDDECADVEIEFVDEESDCEDDLGSEIQQLFATIVDVIDNLYKLSIHIRNPKARTNYPKAATFKAIDKETGVDLVLQYEHFDVEHTRNVFHEVRKELPKKVQEQVANDHLIERLGKAITKRRQQFMYWERHRAKLAANTHLEDSPQVEQYKLDSETRSKPEKGKQVLDRAPERSIVTKTAFTATTATLFTPKENLPEDGQSIISVATTARGLDGRRVDLPPPPKQAMKDKDFECPYCYTICPSRYLHERSWRIHLLRDLRPYVCTHQHCDEADKLFASRQEWNEHELWAHRKVWECSVHPGPEFGSAKAMEAHIRQNHVGFEESQLPILIKMGETTSRASARSCPICFFDEPDRDRLQSHIAFHLESLASFALPRDRIDLDGGLDSKGDLSHIANVESGSSESQDLESLILNESQKAGSEQEEEVELQVKADNNPSVSPSTPEALEVPERNSVSLPSVVADFGSTVSSVPDPEENSMRRGPSGQPETAPESESFPPLHRAVQAKDHDSVKHLLEAGCSKDAVDSHNRSAVYWAVEHQRREDQEILNMLLEYGCSPDSADSDSRTPLMNAIIHGYVGSARRLLQAKANVQSRDNSGHTPLHLAASHGLEMVVEDLLSHGAEVNVRNHFAETPLHTASAAPHEAVVKALINHQADLTLKNSAGMTCLHLAARRGSPSVVSLLLKNGAAPDELGDFNQTALHMTAIGGHESAAYVLLAHHADVNIRDSNGKTAWDVAIKSGHAGLMKLLLPDQYKDIKTEISFEMDAMMRYWLPSSNEDYPSFDDIRHISREVELNETQVHAWFCKTLSEQVRDSRVENSSHVHDSTLEFQSFASPYALRVINLPLVEQTRRTRIAKKIELSKDKTEFWIPALAWRCIDYLNINGSSGKGLYRVPGSGEDVKKWEKRFDTDFDIDLLEQSDLSDAKTIGSLFKNWLRDLPDDILPKETQDRIHEQCSGETQYVPQPMKDELSRLPPFNYYLLFAVTCHITLLTQHSGINKMDYDYFCINFQPCLRMDAYCFEHLVKRWRDCWQGCWTEKEYLERELEYLHEQAVRALERADSSDNLTTSPPIKKRQLLERPRKWMAKVLK